MVGKEGRSVSIQTVHKFDKVQRSRWWKCSSLQTPCPLRHPDSNAEVRQEAHLYDAEISLHLTVILPLIGHWLWWQDHSDEYAQRVLILLVTWQSIYTCGASKRTKCNVISHTMKTTLCEGKRGLQYGVSSISLTELWNKMNMSVS